MKKIKLFFIALLPIALLSACASDSLTLDTFQQQAENLVGKEVKITGTLGNFNQDGTKSVLLGKLPEGNKQKDFDKEKPQGERPQREKPQGERPQGEHGHGHGHGGQHGCMFGNFSAGLEINFAEVANKEYERKEVTIEGIVTEQRITLEEVEKLEQDFMEKHPQRHHDTTGNDSLRMPPHHNHNRGQQCDSLTKPDCNTGATEHVSPFERVKKQIEESGKGYISRYYIENAKIVK